MIFLTRQEQFSAAHKLFRPDWSNEKNTEVFGKCANPNWHGHNYILQVTVKGDVDPETGFVVDLSKLSELINEKVIRHVDHKNLNLDVPFMKGKMTSTEMLAVAVWDELVTHVAALGCELHSVKLQETAKNSVEYFGQK